jgi:Heparinase II/III-like protein/Heparinase II/III N-terminus
MGGEFAGSVATADAGTVGRFWIRPGMRSDALVPPVAWDELLAEDRSLHYHLHALDPIGFPLAAYSQKADPRWIDHALGLALDWLNAHPSRETKSAFAWYDMAVGLRAYRLAYLLDVVARDESRPDDAVRRLLDGLDLHLEALADDSEFAAHSNHGLYQAAGQLAAVRRFPELDKAGRRRAQAEERLTRMIDAQFTEEGVHSEHSPGYHRIVLATLIRLTASGLVDDSEAVERVERTEEALAWFVRPDGSLAPIGDTDAKRLPREPFDSAHSGALRLMATRGEKGAAPEEHVKAFPESGYVVFRERWPSGPRDFNEGAHLVQACGFHSRTHKHADDLSFTWFEHGREILIDPGRFGYRRDGELSPELARLGFMYSDPRRVYVESTRAHNAVEIDRRSHNRRAIPYGSALDAWGECDGAYWARSSATFAEHVEHVRLLLFAPRRFLLVIDNLEDRAGGTHDFCQRFHVAPEFGAVEQDGVVTLSSDDERLPPLHVRTLSEARSRGVVRGQHDPELLGWTSPEPGSLVPASTFAFEREGVSRTHFATLFWWGGR